MLWPAVLPPPPALPPLTSMPALPPGDGPLAAPPEEGSRAPFSSCEAAQLRALLRAALAAVCASLAKRDGGSGCAAAKRDAPAPPWLRTALPPPLRRAAGCDVPCASRSSSGQKKREHQLVRLLYPACAQAELRTLRVLSAMHAFAALPSTAVHAVCHAAAI